MTDRELAIQALIFVEPMRAHDEKCTAHRDHTKCDCYQRENAQIRLEALENAGWKKVTEESDVQ